MSTPDTTARDRIVDAALSLFAARGTEAVSIRDIAAAAHVSPALIPHHFGSKAGLVEAVDARVAGAFDGLRSATSTADSQGFEASSFAEIMLTHLPAGSPIPAYLRRALLEGAPAGRAFFTQWLAMSREVYGQMVDAGLATASADPDVRAAFLMVNDLAVVLLQDHLTDALGIDPLTPAGLTRWTADVLDAYTRGVFTAPPEGDTP